MSKFWKLRYSGSTYRITDDYTLDEREEVKRWVNIAKERTKIDHDEGTMVHDGWCEGHQNPVYSLFKFAKNKDEQ